MITFSFVNCLTLRLNFKVSFCLQGRNIFPATKHFIPKDFLPHMILKKKRNKVFHDFNNGLSNFNFLLSFYHDLFHPTLVLTHYAMAIDVPLDDIG